VDAADKRIVPTRCGDVEYAESGAGEPVLVIHGIFGGRDAGIVSFGGLLPNRRVLAPSRFGYTSARQCRQMHHPSCRRPYSSSSSITSPSTAST